MKITSIEDIACMNTPVFCSKCTAQMVVSGGDDENPTGWRRSMCSDTYHRHLCCHPCEIYVRQEVPYFIVVRDEDLPTPAR